MRLCSGWSDRRLLRSSILCCQFEAGRSSHTLSSSEKDDQSFYSISKNNKQTIYLKKINLILEAHLLKYATLNIRQFGDLILIFIAPSEMATFKAFLLLLALLAVSQAAYSTHISHQLAGMSLIAY